MSSKNKSKSWQRQRPSTATKHNCLPFSAEQSNGSHGHRQGQNGGNVASPRSRRNSQTDQFNGPNSPLCKDAKVHSGQSRLPVYTANGAPHGYNYPNDPHEYRTYSSRTFFNQMPSSPIINNNHSSRNYGGSNSPSYPSTPGSYIVPYDVRLQHAVHQCQWSDCDHRSAPSSSRTTPLSSGSGTPTDSNRKKKFNGVKSSSSTPSKALSRQSSVQGSARSAPSSSVKNARTKQFDQYMPLCEVQRQLKKGEVIEGVLRINPRNYEDAYISAPDAETDIYICGINGRNRALNGDKVAVKINPQSEWKVLYDNIRSRWDDWGSDILKCAENKRGGIQNNDRKNTRELETIEEDSGCVTISSEFRPVKKDGVPEPESEPKPSTSTKNNGHFADSSPLPTLQLLNIQDFISTCDAVGDHSLSTVVQTPNDATHSTLTVYPHEVLTKEHVMSQVTSENLQAAKSKKPKTGLKKIVPLEELEEEDSPFDYENQESDVEYHIEQTLEDLQHIGDCENVINNNDVLNTQVLEGNQPQTSMVPVKPSDQSLKSLIEKLNSMQVIVHAKAAKSSTAQVTAQKKPKKKNDKKSKKVKDKQAAPTKESKFLKSQVTRNSKVDIVRKLALPEEVAILEPNDFTKLSFWQNCVQRTGTVVAILEQNHPRAAGGRLKLTADRNPDFALFSPLDSKIPRILIPMSYCPKDFFHHPDYYSNSLFAAEIEQWPENSTLPIGRLQKILGKVGDIEAETEMILLENAIDSSNFDETVYEGMPKVEDNSEFEIPKEEWDSRRLFTNECVFTIDPPTAKDLDDALSIKQIDEKGPNAQQLFEVGVHIADVSYFVTDGSNCDRIAKSRATSVYLVQRVIPMLPRLLCEKLCSLNPGENKLTFSAVFKMDLEGVVYEEWFGRTIIKSCIKLSYPLAQDMIDNPNTKWKSEEFPQIYDNWNLEDISTRVNQLMAIARSLRKKRFDSGALHFSRLKLWFDLDSETGLPLSCAPETKRESNHLVEEFMLLANMAVARKIYSFFPEKAFLRRHPPPDAKLLKEFEEFCAHSNLPLDTTSSERFKASVSSLISDKNLADVVSHYFLRSMTVAQYFCPGSLTDQDKFFHYALNVPLYTHFTSPIRRFPDIIVHRLLACALGYRSSFDTEVEELKNIAKRCNDRKLAATCASESSINLFKNLYIKQVGPLVVEGVVSQVLDHAFDVMISQFGHIARVYVETLDISSFQYKGKNGQAALTLTWRHKKENGSNLQVIVPFLVVPLKIMITEQELSKWSVSLLFGEESSV